MSQLLRKKYGVSFDLLASSIHIGETGNIMKFFQTNFLLLTANIKFRENQLSSFQDEAF
jgi:hypothetical protein